VVPAGAGTRFTILRRSFTWEVEPEIAIVGDGESTFAHLVGQVAITVGLQAPSNPAKQIIFAPGPRRLAEQFLVLRAQCLERQLAALFDSQ